MHDSLSLTRSWKQPFPGPGINAARHPVVAALCFCLIRPFGCKLFVSDMNSSSRLDEPFEITNVVERKYKRITQFDMLQRRDCQHRPWCWFPSLVVRRCLAIRNFTILFGRTLSFLLCIGCNNREQPKSPRQPSGEVSSMQSDRGQLPLKTTGQSRRIFCRSRMHITSTQPAAPPSSV